MASATTALPKHVRYKSAYTAQPAGLYWGLGIEEETYLHFTRSIHVAPPVLRLCHAPERYSVPYSTTYKPSLLAAALEAIYPDASGCIPVPFCVNSHGLTAMDVAGHHKTTYTSPPRPNPAFTGSTWFEELQAYDPYFKTNYEVNFVFDGDSIEFMTQDFYCARSPAVIKELVDAKAAFLSRLNAFVAGRRLFRRHTKGKFALMWAPTNPAFVVNRTNPSQVAMFNNGTYHINITLPSYIEPGADIPTLRYPSAFISDHRKFIRLIQWTEPFILAVYGSPDPLGFTKASQRCAVSRYIGVGTYDTRAMTEGKLLTSDISKIRGTNKRYWWYRRFHETSGYAPLKEIGFDINFKKHYNHGVEIRCLDWFPEEHLPGLIAFFIRLADVALSRPLAPEAILSETWNDLVVGVMREGVAYRVDAGTTAVYELILGIPLTQGTVGEIFAQLTTAVSHVKGECVRLML